MTEQNDNQAVTESENIRSAAEVRKLLKEHNVHLINLMASPGAGKTSLLEQTIERLKGQYRIAVLEADEDADSDAKRIEAHGAKALKIYTGSSFRLNASVTLEALKKLDLDSLDLVFLENESDLAAPEESDTGADLKVMILSVPEGDDKPLKYPLLFQIADCLLINKIDSDKIIDFDLQKLYRNVGPLNNSIQIIPVSAFTGSGIENWLIYLREKMIIWKNMPERD